MLDWNSRPSLSRWLETSGGQFEYTKIKILDVLQGGTRHQMPWLAILQPWFESHREFMGDTQEKGSK